LEKAKNPEAVMHRCFEKSIETAVAEAVNTGKPDRIGVSITSERLTLGPIWIPINKYRDVETSVKEVVRRFDQVNQEYQERNILGAPFQVEVTLICLKELAKDMQKSGFNGQSLSGKGRRRKTNCTVEHSIVENGIIHINNDNNYCLFYAAEMARLNHSMKNRCYFFRYRSNQSKQKQMVDALLEQAKIPKMKEYDARQWLPVIQQFYDDHYPEQYRFYVFSKYGQYKPLFKTGKTGTPLILYYDAEQEHFDTIKSIRQFFGAKNHYCWDCESPYR
jgi:hypothetical protein